MLSSRILPALALFCTAVVAQSVAVVIDPEPTITLPVVPTVEPECNDHVQCNAKIANVTVKEIVPGSSVITKTVDSTSTKVMTSTFISTFETYIAEPVTVGTEGDCWRETTQTETVVPTVTVTRQHQSVQWSIDYQSTTVTHRRYYTITQHSACQRKIGPTFTALATGPGSRPASPNAAPTDAASVPEVASPPRTENRAVETNLDDDEDDIAPIIAGINTAHEEL